MWQITVQPQSLSKKDESVNAEIGQHCTIDHILKYIVLQ